MIRFKKIKITKEGKIHISYELKVNDGWDEYNFTSSESPKGSFTQAVNALREDVIGMCELPLDKTEKINVRSVSFSYGGDNDVMGATISAQMLLLHSNTPLNLNTPHKAEEPYSETGDDSQVLDAECVDRLTELQSEAEDYLKGIRAQIDMFTKVPA